MISNWEDAYPVARACDPIDDVFWSGGHVPARWLPFCVMIGLWIHVACMITIFICPAMFL